MNKSSKVSFSDMNKSSKVSFSVTKTSKGYLIKGIDIPGIILEVPTQDKIIKYTLEALDYYVKDLQTEQIESFELTVPC